MDKNVTGRDRVSAAYKGTFADVVPAYPIAGSFAGCLDGLSIEEYCTNPTKAVKAMLNYYERYQPDIMIAFSYPPDTFMLTEQSIANDFNPKFKFLSVGVAFPSFKGKFADKANGTFGLGAWDPNGPGVKEYVERHKAVNKGAEPDRWASSNTYAGLQILRNFVRMAG